MARKVTRMRCTVARRLNRLDARIADLRDQVAGAICRTVVLNQDLYRNILGEDGFDGFLDVLAVIEGGHHHGDLGDGHRVHRYLSTSESPLRASLETNSPALTSALSCPRVSQTSDSPGLVSRESPGTKWTS